MKGKDSLGKATGSKENIPASVPPASMPEKKSKRSHKLSHAAHLKEHERTKAHTEPAGDQRENVYPINRRNP